MIGRASSVARRVELDFSAMPRLADPEEQIRRSARSTIAACLESQEPSTVVKVCASGSQSTHFGPDNRQRGHVNFLRIEIQPQLGFVE